MRTAAVILNYNDAEGTVDAVKRINGFFCFDSIVVVDNASTDGSGALLKAAAGELGDRVFFLQAEKNGGYGYGNNLGVRYAGEMLGAELAVIANPDAVFEEELVLKMRQAFEKDPELAAAGAVMHNGSSAYLNYTEYLHSGWKRRGLAGCVLNACPVLRRVFRGGINYPLSYYKKAGEAVPVYAVHGSLLMVSVKKFLQAGGYDEAMFLYGEETVLAEKFRRIGGRTVLLKYPYRHAGSVSITGAGLGAVRRQKLRNRSELYYYEHYLGAGRAALLLAEAVQGIVLLETRLAAALLKER